MSGCSKEEAPEPTEPVKLKIMAHDEGTFNRVYGCGLAIQQCIQSQVVREYERGDQQCNDQCGKGNREGQEVSWGSTHFYAEGTTREIGCRAGEGQ